MQRVISKTERRKDMNLIVKNVSSLRTLFYFVRIARGKDDFTTY